MRKKVFAIILTLCMVLTMMPAVAWAGEQSDALVIMSNDKAVDAPYLFEPIDGMGFKLMRGVKDSFGKTGKLTPLTYKEQSGSEVLNFDSYAINVYKKGVAEAICTLSNLSSEKAYNNMHKIGIGANDMMKSTDESSPVLFFDVTVGNDEERKKEPGASGLYKITVECKSKKTTVFSSEMYFYVSDDTEWEQLASGEGWYIAVDWNVPWTNLGFTPDWEGNDAQKTQLKATLEIYKNGIDNIIIQGAAKNIPCDYLDKTLGNLSCMDTRDESTEKSENYIFDSDDAALYAKNGENVDKTTKLVTIKVFNQGGGEEGPQLFIRSEKYNCYPGDRQVGNGMFNVPIQVIFQGNQVTTGYEVFVENKEDGEIVKNDDGTFTYVPKVSGERKVTIKHGELYADFYFYVSEDDISGGGDEENGDEINRQRDWTLGIPSEDGYIPVAPNPIWSEVPTYFMHYNNDSYENFYIMRKDDAAKVGTETQQPELVIEGDTFTSEPKGPCDGYWIWKIKPTDKQPIKENFDRTKLKVKLNDESVTGRTETNIWVLGKDYRYSDTNFYTGNNIVLSSNLPQAKQFNSGDELWKNLKPLSDEGNIFYTDMSQEADADRNRFYVFHEKGTTLKVDATKLYSFDDGGTSLSGNTGGAFEKLLDEDNILTLTLAGEYTFQAENNESVVFAATKVSLKKYIGYENIRLSFAAVDNSNGNNNPPVGEARMEIRNGTTIKIEGDTEGVTKFRDAHNILNEALGFPAVTKDFVGGEAYFDKAHATFSEDGQGLVCAFDIDLKPGYVIDSITDENSNPYKYIVKYTYYYDVFDKNGQRLSTLDEMNKAGWWEAIGSGYDGQQREACMAHQEVAVSGFNVPYLDETVTSFKDFLDGKLNGMPPERISRAPYKAKRIGAYVDYTVLFDETQSTEPHSIVFHVSRPEDFRGSKIDIHGKNNIKIDINEVIDFDKTRGNDNIAQLCENGWEIEKIYEIGAADSENSNNAITNANGLVNITISETELSGNPEDYIVVYFTDEGVPMEMPTTYVEGQGIVFTTGHFSKYAVVNKKGVNDPNPTPNPGTPGGLPTTPSGDPTQSGTTTTTDLSGSTVSKGGETTTTVDQSTADKLVEKATANKSEEIVISAVTKNQSAASSTKSAEVTLPAETLSAIAEKTDADVVIKTDVAEVKLDNQAAEAIASQAQASAETTGKAETVSIVAEKVKEEAEEVRFELKVVTSSGNVISDFKGGSISVTVNVPKSLSNKKLVCVYIDENGMMHKVDGQLNADGTYTFSTGHFSTYSVMSEEDAEAAIAEQKEAVKAAKFKLRSQIVKTKSGKKAIRITWTNPTDIKFDGVEIYRSTKKNIGYGKKPIYVSKSDKYINTAVKSGKKYHYKVRAFVTIDGEKVYTDYSYKAYRTVK